MSCNNILSHTRDIFDPVQLQLHESYVLHTLTYVTGAIKLSKRQIASLNACWNSVYRRIFHFDRWESVRSFIRGLIDFTKAFNSVDHLTLIVKLKNLNIVDNIIPWVVAFLTDRNQFVKIGEKWSFTKIASLCRGLKLDLRSLLFVLLILNRSVQ